MVLASRLSFAEHPRPARAISFSPEERDLHPLKIHRERGFIFSVITFWLVRAFHEPTLRPPFFLLEGPAPRRGSNKAARTRRVAEESSPAEMEFVSPGDSIVFLAVSWRSQRGSVAACFIPITINATLIALSWPLLIGSFKRHCFGLMLLPAVPPPRR